MNLCHVNFIFYIIFSDLLAMYQSIAEHTRFRSFYDVAVKSFTSEGHACVTQRRGPWRPGVSLVERTESIVGIVLIIHVESCKPQLRKVTDCSVELL